ncbi:DUF4352 domain-containing protein [Oceanobacillus damuensis]|uniref:hypothetical protein n=1 Tax=Oceanobacillus damuensis TaxID=937928 RepID=UPI0008359EB6|nr:hypothetical protein [Oceanobacillus damuensis]
MDKKIFNIVVLLMGVLLLSACGNGEDAAASIPVPEELIENEEPLAIKDQFDLSIGDNGWVIDYANRNILEFTLNSVEIATEINGERPRGNDSADDVYVIANYTMKNHGDIEIPGQGVEYPLLVDAKDNQEIENDSFEGDFLGTGNTGIGVENAMSKQKPTAPGEERTGNIVLLANYEVDTYMIYFGDDEYQNKLTWEFDATEAKR